ncbi:MFS transporter [Nocardia carnea]|uniref:MFS transporter n=1 Tax=Nocardia carnea TaxID=37328 RepID=UPI0024547083|nr:MFS transporter [Nocardia carnea]
MRASVSARLGADFHKLWTASAVSNLGDGFAAVAGPLLVASLTSDPVAIAAAGLAQQLPWLLFALLSGAVSDRLDRRRLIVVVDVLRAVLVGGLAIAIATGTVSLVLLYCTLFLMGIGETLADTAVAGRLPAVVPADLLPAANARLGFTFSVINMWLAKPVGGWLFALSAAVPFGANAATFVLAAMIAATMRPHSPPPPAESTGLWRDIREGVEWLWRHRRLRALILTMGVMQIPFCAAFATFVLYARDRLGLAEVGFGLLLTAHAAGALAGSALAARLERRLGLTLLLRAGLIAETATHLVLALTTNAWVAGATLAAFSVHAAIWGVVVATVRQREVPERLQGRIVSVHNLLDVTGVAAGTLLGGFLAHWFGPAGPFWIGFATMCVISTCAWRHIRY